MKHLYLLVVVGTLFLTSCNSGDRKEREGKIVYAIEYPDHKDNFFLYSILPKEMELQFRDGKMESFIHKANLTNTLVVDCNQKSMGAYFRYGNDACHTQLSAPDVQHMLADQKKYTIRFTEEKDTLAGFHVSKAIAIAVKDPSDKITLWYTDEIDVPHSNWYNPFREVPGFLLAYSIDRYGIRMVFKAKRFEKMHVTDKHLKLSNDGKDVAYSVYNKKLGELFQSFE